MMINYILTVIFLDIQPSSTTTAPSSSAAVDDGLGDKNAQRNGDDKRVIIIIIGAVGGSAIVLGICVLMIIVFYKRRKSRYVCKASLLNQAIACLKWIFKVARSVKHTSYITCFSMYMNQFEN